MFEFLDQTAGTVVAIKATEKLTHADYQKFLAKCEAVIEEHGHVRVLFDMTELHGWEPAAMVDDLKFDVHHRRDIQRCAIIGDKKWQEWMIRLSKPFFPGEVKYFQPSESAEASTWIKA